MRKSSIYGLFFCLFIGLIFVGIYTGNLNLSFKDIFLVMANPNNSIDSTVVWDIRIPRIIVSLFVGASLGLAGALMQLSSRSSLADPNLFGIGGGAVIFLAAVYAGVFSLNTINTFVGCIIFSVLIAWALAKLISTPNLTPIKLAIMGIAVGSLTVALGTSIVSHGKVFPTQVIGLVSGSFTSSNWSVVSLISISFMICLIASLTISKKIYPMILGDSLSKSLGINPFQVRTISMIIVGILAGSAVYSGGLIGFVGLISPHIARKVFGKSQKRIIINSVLTGGLVSLAADQITRLVFMPVEVPVSLTTTLVGAPLMMYLGLKLK